MPTEGTDWVVARKQEEVLDLHPAPGLSIVDWSEVGVRVIPGDDPTLPPADFPWNGTDALVMRRRATAALSDLIRPHTFLLPLDDGDAGMALVYVTRYIDGLDESASTIRRFNSGRVRDIQHFAFIPAMIEGVPIFKIPQLPDTLVTDRFVEAVRDNGLTGLRFVKVWKA